MLWRNVGRERRFAVDSVGIPPGLGLDLDFVREQKTQEIPCPMLFYYNVSKVNCNCTRILVGKVYQGCLVFMPECCVRHLWETEKLGLRFDTLVDSEEVDGLCLVLV